MRHPDDVVDPLVMRRVQQGVEALVHDLKRSSVARTPLFTGACSITDCSVRAAVAMQREMSCMIDSRLLNPREPRAGSVGVESGFP